MQNTSEMTPKRPPRRRFLFLLLLVIVLALPLIAVVAVRFYPGGSNALVDRIIFWQRWGAEATPTPAPVATRLPSETPTLPPATLTPSPTLNPTPSPVWNAAFTGGLAVLSMDEIGYARLFAYSPGGAPLVRLTAGDWDDIDPSISPDGTQLAFASNRDGPWDLYRMELGSGSVTRLTDSPQYDGHPGWSPDGQWMTYDSYVPDEAGGGSLEIFIRPVDGSQPPIQLTDDPGADHSPVWSPGGRQVAFVSTRGGEPDIWLADLDVVEERFTNLSHNQAASEAAPMWSPDGTRLAWSSQGADGLAVLELWDANAPAARVRQLNTASRAAWNPDGTALLAVLNTPNESYLTGYRLDDGSLALAISTLSGVVHGLAWNRGSLPVPLPAPIAEAASLSPAPLYAPAYLNDPSQSLDRVSIVPLLGVQAQTPALHDGVDEAYYALRERVAQAAGWDFLATLEQSYTPLTSPLFPGMSEDWLYTGRALRFNTAPLSAGWIALVREDYGPQTYWRVYLRARFQDGALGLPLTSQPWDLGARFSGDPLSYERGGSLSASPPPGYWIDFTRLASAYGWERMPALTTWRAAFSAARFNEYVLRDGLDWMSAMLEVYPRSALNTPTPVLSPTITNTPTRTPTFTPWPTITRRPTFTPIPSMTRWPTATPSLTATRRPTITPTPTVTYTPRPSRTPTPND